MPGFNDWIHFEPVTVAGIDSAEEVEELARENLARRLQENVRGRVDPGFSLREARRAQAVRVHSEGDRLVIDAEDESDALDASTQLVRDEPDDTVAQTVNQLFELGTGVPKVVRGADGEERLLFRSISLENLFGTQRQVMQDESVEQTVTESLRGNIVDAYEDAFAEVGKRHPR